ncbi:bile acid:sodium symporter, partial [Comamonas thiooxydans]
MSRPRFVPDNFTLALIATVIFASFLPASGQVAKYVELTTTGIVSLLFFLHGAKLSRQAILAGIGHWRLHIWIFIATFVLFPVLGLALRPVLSPLVTT